MGSADRATNRDPRFGFVARLCRSGWPDAATPKWLRRLAAEVGGVDPYGRGHRLGKPDGTSVQRAAARMSVRALDPLEKIDAMVTMAGTADRHGSWGNELRKLLRNQPDLVGADPVLLRWAQPEDRRDAVVPPSQLTVESLIANTLHPAVGGMEPARRDRMLCEAVALEIGRSGGSRRWRNHADEDITTSCWLPAEAVESLPVGWLCWADPAAPSPAHSVSRWLAGQDLTADAADLVVAWVAEPESSPLLPPNPDLGTVVLVAKSLLA